MTRARLALAAAAAASSLLPTAAAAQLAADPAPFIAVALEGTLARYPQEPRLAAGGALSGRLLFLEAALTLDWAVRSPRDDAGLRSTALVGLGLVHDLGPLASLHALAVAGGYDVSLRDFVWGGWRTVDETAVGGRATLRLHPPARLARLGTSTSWPVAGLSLTVLRVTRGADRLRRAEWGGTMVAVTLSLGAELVAVARHRADGP